MRALTLERTFAADRPRNLAGIAYMTVSWSMAGGIAAGVLIVVLVLTSRVHSMGLVSITAVVAMAGSLLGSVHGVVLGYLGRGEPNSKLGWRNWALVVVAAAAGSAIAVPFAVWLVLSAMAMAAGGTSGAIGLFIAVPVTLIVFAWATLNGWDALEAAYTRWPQKRLGTLLVVGVFAVLSASMLILRGAIPGTEIQLSMLAAIVVVALGVIWIVSPAVIVALSIASRTRR